LRFGKALKLLREDILEQRHLQITVKKTFFKTIVLKMLLNIKNQKDVCF